MYRKTATYSYRLQSLTIFNDNIYRKDEGTRDDQGRDGGTNFILRIKEQDNTPNPSGT